MPDASPSVHPAPFDYDHPTYRTAAAAVKDGSDGHCRLCGRKGPLEAHHWARPYPPADQTTIGDLTALCLRCHIRQHLAWLFEDAGGSPETLCAAWSETVSTLLLRGAAPMPRSPVRVGWPVMFRGQWAALINGESRPRRGEVFQLFMSTWNEWRTVVVTEVVDGRPERWRVRKRFLSVGDEVRSMCLNAAYTEQPLPAAMRRAAADTGVGRDRRRPPPIARCSGRLDSDGRTGAPGRLRGSE